MTDYEIQSDTWYHFAGIFNGLDDMKAYVNGVEVSGSYTGTATSYFHSENSGTLGKSGNPSDLFQGSIDDFRIYKRALSPSEIQILYNQ